MPEAPAVNVAEARRLSFACQPGCGFCCTASPLVMPHESGPLGPLLVRAEDGSLRIPQREHACSALAADKSCRVYADRPAVCHLYPFQVHAGRRIQVTVSLGCPGVATLADATGAEGDAGGLEPEAQAAARRALAQPGAREMAHRAREAFRAFDARMREWGAETTPDRLRAAFVPHADLLARPEALPRFFAGLAPGDLVLEGRPERIVAALFDAEAEVGAAELLEEAAQDAFDEPETVLWVEPDLAWTRVEQRDSLVRLHRHRGGGDRTVVELPLEAVPLEWTEEAVATLAAYLRRLAHRDHTEGAAAWLADASGYRATLAAAYGRVLGEASLQVLLRAGLLALEREAQEVDAATARRGISAYETSFHSLPTLGAIL